MLVVCLIWGLNFSFTKFALDQIPPLPFTAIRFVLASLLLALVLRATEGDSDSIDWTQAAGGSWSGGEYRLSARVHRRPLTHHSHKQCPDSFHGAHRGSPPCRRPRVERITPRTWVGIALGTLGVVLVIATRGVGFDAKTLPGDFLTLSAVLCWSGYTVGLRRVPAGITPLRVTAITTMAGTPLLVLAGLPGMVRLTGRQSTGAWLRWAMPRCCRWWWLICSGTGV